MAVVSYEAPTLEVLGSVKELTLGTCAGTGDLAFSSHEVLVSGVPTCL